MDKAPNQAPNIHDRRNALGLPLTVRVECRTPQAFVFGQCQNISETGILVSSKVVFPEGKDVFVRFELAQEPTGLVVEIAGIIVRTSESHAMAIKFLQLQQEQRTAIAEYVARYLAQGGSSLG